LVLCQPAKLVVKTIVHAFQNTGDILVRLLCP
jgi:hypothetical protein